MLTDDEIHAALREIAVGYGIFQCEICADEMQEWLVQHDIVGTRLMLQSRGSDFMISTRVGDHMSITQNGRHYGIEVRGRVYDNLPNPGLLVQAWLDDFECLDGFVVRETEF